jgi:hypothetical protein
MAEWLQAYPRLLQLVKIHLPKELDLWTAHYTFITTSDGAFGKKFTLFREYNRCVRDVSTRIPLDPSVLQTKMMKEAWEIYDDEQTTLRAESLILRKSSLRQGSTSGAGMVSRQDSGLPNTGGPGLCFWCASREPRHPIGTCAASTQVDGSPVLCIGPGLSNKDGNRYCIKANTTAGCPRRPCAYCHACTLCAASDHITPECPKALGQRSDKTKRDRSSQGSNPTQSG